MRSARGDASFSDKPCILQHVAGAPRFYAANTEFQAQLTFRRQQGLRHEITGIDVDSPALKTARLRC